MRLEQTAIAWVTGLYIPELMAKFEKLVKTTHQRIRNSQREIKTDRADLLRRYNFQIHYVDTTNIHAQQWVWNRPTKKALQQQVLAFDAQISFEDDVVFNNNNFFRQQGRL